MDYESQFALEVVTVGSMTVAGSAILNSTKLHPTLKIFLVGAMIHVFCEASGINAWYIENGAVTMLNRPYKKPPPLPEYKSCSYFIPSSSSLEPCHIGSIYDIEPVSK
jgi:hypothetical protein